MLKSYFWQTVNIFNINLGNRSLNQGQELRFLKFLKSLRYFEQYSLCLHWNQLKTKTPYPLFYQIKTLSKKGKILWCWGQNLIVKIEIRFFRKNIFFSLKTINIRYQKSKKWLDWPPSTGYYFMSNLNNLISRLSREHLV